MTPTDPADAMPDDLPLPAGPPLRSGAGPRPRGAVALDRFLWFAFAAAMIVMLPAMTLLIALDVIGRVFFATPIRGALDLVGLGLLLTFVFSLPYSWRGNYHVRMDMLYAHFPSALRVGIDVAAGVAAACFALLLAYQAAKYIPHLIRVGSASVTLGVPYWPFAIAIFVSAVLFTLSVVQEMILILLNRTGDR